MTENEVIGWLRLQRIPGIGPVNARRLVTHFGGVQAIFTQKARGLAKLSGIGTATAEKLMNPIFGRDAEGEYHRAVAEGIRCLTLTDPSYPPLLRECPDAPLVLFQKGPVSLVGRRLLSIVGTRSMTEYGRGFCEAFLRELLPFNPVIISGLATGVDVCAQRSAIKAGLSTVSCLGHGLDSMYPRAHARYVPEILGNGALLTEFWLGTPPGPMNFVRRNRIIAGLSPATVVVESGPKGGSLITADLAFGYDREVFAVPGRISDRFSTGCNLLIREQKAHLLQSAGQLAAALNWDVENETGAPVGKRGVHSRNLSPEESRIADFLAGNGAQGLDEIALACFLSVREAASLLFQMEMAELIRARPGKIYELTSL
jgi:DNA processing protein